MAGSRFNTTEYAGYEFLTQGWHFDQIFILGGVFAIGIVGTIGFLLLTTAYRIADPAKISPFEYSGLIATMLGGFIFWGDIPSMKEALGMILIVGSGIVLFYRENRRNQTIASEAPLR